MLTNKNKINRKPGKGSVTCGKDYKLDLKLSPSIRNKNQYLLSGSFAGEGLTRGATNFIGCHEINVV